MSRTKVCLVYPRHQYLSGDPPLGLGYIAAYARNSNVADITLIDSTFVRHLSLPYIYSRIRQERPDILGIYVDTLMFNNAREVMRWARANGTFVIVGGPHASVSPQTCIDDADVVVIGEGEEAFTDIISHYRHRNFAHIPSIWWWHKGELVKNEIGLKKIDIDALPFVDRDIFDMEQYLLYWHYLDSVGMGIKGTTMITSRGCPFRCAYCQPTLEKLFGKRIRRRSPQNVVEEMRWLKDRYGIQGIFFHDDTFMIERNWIAEFCSELEKSGVDLLWGCNGRIDRVSDDLLKRMHGCGLRNIHFGIESGSQRVLDKVYNKGISLERIHDLITTTKKIGITTMGFFMLGAPTESEEEINATIRLANKLPLEEATFSITNPLIGTDLHDMVSQNPDYKISENFSDFDYYRKRAMSGGNISYGKLKWLQKKALIFFYLSPIRLRYIAGHFRSLSGIKKMIQKIRRFV